MQLLEVTRWGKEWKAAEYSLGPNSGEEKEEEEQKMEAKWGSGAGLLDASVGRKREEEGEDLEGRGGGMEGKGMIQILTSFFHLFFLPLHHLLLLTLDSPSE